MKLILQPFSRQSLGGFLKSELGKTNSKWKSFQAAVAFVKYSGVQHILNELKGFVQQGKYVRIVLGIDQYGSSHEGIAGLLEAVADTGELWINHDINKYVTFHPKLYLFEGESEAVVIIGSGNLTQGGLYTNDEASIVCELNLSNIEDQIFLNEVKVALDGWCNPTMEHVKRIDEVLLETLLAVDYIRTETRSSGEDEAQIRDDQKRRSLTDKMASKPRLFGRGPHRNFPAKPRLGRGVGPIIEEPPSVDDSEPRGFVMTLMRTDVGSGQTTPGTSRRSPEIFVPLSARNMFPKFWQWPDAFVEDDTKPGKFDRMGVLMRLAGEIIQVNMMTWPDKHDFRLRSEALRSAGQVGDIFRLELTENSQEFAYYVEIIPAGTSAYDEHLSLCSNKTPNSKRMWGYYT